MIWTIVLDNNTKLKIKKYNEEQKMNDLQIFKNEEFGEVRTMVIDDEPWFVAVDVCHALDIGNPSQAISKLDEDEKVTLTTNEGHSGKLGGSQMLNVISEAGLYTIILKSRKPEAKAFKRWITCKNNKSYRKRTDIFYQ